MAKQKNIIQRFPTDEEIIHKKELLSEKMKNFTERKSPIQSFLFKIKDVLNVAINEDKISYAKLSEAIFDVYKVKISPSNISKFAIENLGVEKSNRSKSSTGKESNIGAGSTVTEDYTQEDENQSKSVSDPSRFESSFDNRDN